MLSHKICKKSFIKKQISLIFSRPNIFKQVYNYYFLRQNYIKSITIKNVLFNLVYLSTFIDVVKDKITIYLHYKKI